MFFSTLVTTLFKVVVLTAAAFVGIKVGKKILDSKDAKAEDEA